MEKKEITFLDVIHFSCRFSVSWAILYLLLSVFAKSADLELRTRISIPSMLIAGFCLPLLAGTLAIGKMLKRMQQEASRRAAEGIGIMLMLFALVIYLCAAAAVLILSGGSWMQKETKVTKTVLQSVGKAFPWEESVSGGYYRPVGFLFKKKYAYDDLRVVEAVLEQRYGKEFALTAVETHKDTEGVYAAVLVCSAVPKDEPSLAFQVTAERGTVTYYTDNYTEIKQKQHWHEAVPAVEFPAEKAGEGAEAENSFFTPESAYGKLYETVFAPDGYSSETTYNAKGNFYAVLSREEDENTYLTVVYDRVSQNGKCQIFVYYDESGENAQILDFYAVDMETGRVTAGNKQAWNQVASAQYQEATGEK